MTDFNLEAIVDATIDPDRSPISEAIKGVVLIGTPNNTADDSFDKTLLRTIMVEMGIGKGHVALNAINKQIFVEMIRKPCNDFNDSTHVRHTVTFSESKQTTFQDRRMAVLSNKSALVNCPTPSNTNEF